MFGGLWKSWLQKLMNVALWIPILYLMDHFLLTIIKGVLDRVLTNNAGFSILLGSSLLFLMNFGVYLSAPFFSNFVFQGSQSNAKQLAASGKHYLKKGAKASGHMVSAKPNPVATFRTLMQ